MNTYAHQSINVGVDTGKANLDIYIRPLDIFFTVSNDHTGIQEAVNTIKKYNPERIVVEATGRLEMPFIFGLLYSQFAFRYRQSYPHKKVRWCDWKTS